MTSSTSLSKPTTTMTRSLARRSRAVRPPCHRLLPRLGDRVVADHLEAPGDEMPCDRPSHFAQAQDSHRFYGLHLVRLDFRVADHLAPFLELIPHQPRELLGRAGVRHQALARELLAH